MKSNYVVHCATSIGPKGGVNQDSFAFDNMIKVGGCCQESSNAFTCIIKVPTGQVHCAVVADGVSRSSHGELASFSVVDAISKAYAENKFSSRDISENKDTFDSVMTEVSLGLRTKLDKIGVDKKSSSATTVSAVCFDDKKLCCYNIGDSPIYLYRHSRKLRTLHEEHTLDAEKRRYNKGRNFFKKLFEKDVVVFPQDAHILTKCVHSTVTPKIESSFSIEAFIDTDVIILSSDGLDCLPESDIINILADRSRELNVAQSLIEKAYLNCLSDNITVMVIFREMVGDKDE